MPRRTDSQTTLLRQAILVRAVDVASVEGLEGLTIGRLATALSMSKSGLFAHFGSKQELQLAVIEAAAETFRREVMQDGGALPGGRAGLVHLSSAWLRYMEKGLFRGGCFFAAVCSEVDDRPGPVRDRVVELTRSWLEALEDSAAQARESGEFAAETDPAQVAFEIHAFLQEANRSFQLHGDGAAFRRAARAIRQTVDAATTPATAAATLPDHVR